MFLFVTGSNLSPIWSVGLFLVSAFLPRIVGNIGEESRGILTGLFAILFCGCTYYAISHYRTSEGHNTPEGTSKGSVDSLAQKVQSLPVEKYCSPMELPDLPVSELQQRLKHRKLVCNAIEKRDLVDALRRHHSADQSSCSVCCDDFTSCASQINAETDPDAEDDGSFVRVLSCGHVFHIECIDRWVFSTSNKIESEHFVRGCPLCKKEL